ncbi:hypothetical protein NQ246_26545, partial [Escherichia coli]|nr:hypothetical protein [Escherichia coli]
VSAFNKGMDMKGSGIKMVEWLRYKTLILSISSGCSVTISGAGATLGSLPITAIQFQFIFSTKFVLHGFGNSLYSLFIVL